MYPEKILSGVPQGCIVGLRSKFIQYLFVCHVIYKEKNIYWLHR